MTRLGHRSEAHTECFAHKMVRAIGPGASYSREDPADWGCSPYRETRAYRKALKRANTQ